MIVATADFVFEAASSITPPSSLRPTCVGRKDEGPAVELRRIDHFATTQLRDFHARPHPPAAS